MDKLITSDIVGIQSELREIRFRRESFDGGVDRPVLNSEQATAIRSVAEYVIRQLCERHKNTLPAQMRLDFDLAQAGQ